MVTFHVQTVFEHPEHNDVKAGRKAAKRHRIKAPVGYDARLDGARISWFMHRNGAGGTPWTLVVDKAGRVRHSAWTGGKPEPIITLVEKLRKEALPEPEEK